VESDWLTASSFERAQEILSAINTLSIYTKLAAARVPNPSCDAEVPKARARILSFLDELDRLAREAEQTVDDTVVGTDPRMGDLTRRYLAGRKSLPRRSPLFALPITQVRSLIADDNPVRAGDRITCLAELRSLVEQHAHVDAVGLLGNL
jgi:hypothetical protein